MNKRKFRIVTDSGCDLSEEYLQRNDIALVNLGVILDGVDYFGDDGNKISISDFYARLRAGALPTTYQITPEKAKACLLPYLTAGEDVLVVAFSSGLSGTAGSFFVGQKELIKEYPERQIFVVDSLCASLGQGLLVDYLVRKADGGASIEETYDYAQELKEYINHQFTVDDLLHLKRGGRVSSATAIIGTMLNVKPILHVDDEGHLVAIGKAMGRKKSLRKLLENMQECIDAAPGDPIYISHGDCLADAECLKEMIEPLYPDNPVVIEAIGPVIGSHSGCGTVALFFKAKHR